MCVCVQHSILLLRYCHPAAMPSSSCGCVPVQVAAMKGEGGDKARAAGGSSSGANPLLAGTKFDPFGANGEEVSRGQHHSLPPAVMPVACGHLACPHVAVANQLGTATSMCCKSSRCFSPGAGQQP